ncbi:MAG: L,D-transpeptidase family protein [Candidatus Doudnabacteria bacterium]|nr:L,D-transpeptidase family protein [Candidatus Doudnabacteria bacterium]
MKIKTRLTIAFLVLSFAAKVCAAQSLASFIATPNPVGSAVPYTDAQLKNIDSDNDGLSDYDEINIYHTDPHNPDSDGDGYSDGHEVQHGFDPNKNGDDKLEKSIDVDLKTQTLAYFFGPYKIGQFLISSGVPGLPTPPGNYSVLKKIPVVDYKGSNYNYPNTKWNMMFKLQKVGNLYIHGAYWHHNFGHPMSHGCINVAYANMEPLYKWTDVGTKVIIQ